MTLEKALKRYVREITGERPRIEQLPAEQAGRLPLFLKAAYGFSRMSLFHNRLMLAIQRVADDQLTPSEYAGHARQIRDVLGQSAVLVLHRLASYARNRMVRQGISFIVPGKQMFLPMAGVDLRERFPGQVRDKSSRLSVPTQVVLLYHLLGREAEGIPLRELAGKVGYSAMTLSNVRAELQANSLCEVRTRGRSRQLAFPLPRQELWLRVKDGLQPPNRAGRWVHWASAVSTAPKAGLSALARYTHLGEDKLPVFALRRTHYRRRLETGTLRECAGPEDANATVELWSYDPLVLASREVVDRLSLYLSLRDSGDERIQAALKELLGGVTW